MEHALSEDRLRMPKISVVICAHNPRPDYLARVLDALRVQTLPQADWELLLIDNASSSPLANQIDLSWHYLSRHIREDELGLTPARLRGIAEGVGSIVVFVDDDNALDRDFLEQAIKIGKEYPFLGAWGGTIHPEFEVEPAEWTKPFWASLAVRNIREPAWTNVSDLWQAQPCGAGLCVRMPIAQKYLQELSCDGVRRRLDRTGSSLLSTGDTDLVLTSEKLGLGWGVFPELKLTHLLPKGRLEEEYLLRLTEGMAASSTALKIRRNGKAGTPHVGLSLLARRIYRRIRFGVRAERFFTAEQRGIAAGYRLIQDED